MSSISTQDMVSLTLERCRFGAGNSLAMARLNEAYRRIVQPTGFVWEQKRTTLSVVAAATTVTLPSDMAPGKPKALGGPTGYESTIPYLPWEQFMLQQRLYNNASTSPGAYSAWSYSWSSTGSPATYSYTAYLGPDAAKPTVSTGTFTLPFVYHIKPIALTNGASTYFPSPDEFDDVLIWMAAASIQQTYGIQGWQDLEKMANMALAPLIDVYKSTNLDLGLNAQTAQTAETNQKRQD